jgi:excisionase family DNA binding protein
MRNAPEKLKTSKGFLSLQEAASYLDVAVDTMYQWRARGIGPTGVKIGNRVKYRRETLDAWVAGREQAEADRIAKITG